MDVDWLETDLTEHAVAFNVDEHVYSVSAVLRTAYWFTDRAYVFISAPAPHILRVHIKPKPATLDSPLQPSATGLAGEFGNSLLDNRLREAVQRTQYFFLFSRKASVSPCQD